MLWWSITEVEPDKQSCGSLEYIAILMSSTKGMLRFVSGNKLARMACGGLAAGSVLTGCEGLIVRQMACPAPHDPCGLSLQDVPLAAEVAVQSLLVSSVFDRVPHHPAVLAIGRFENHTSRHLDTSLLTGQISAALLQSGKVVVAKMEPQSVDASAGSAELARPDFTLSGRVFETIERSGRFIQSTYVFQLSLTDSNGVAVWAESKTITKQGKRATGGS